MKNLDFIKENIAKDLIKQFVHCFWYGILEYMETCTVVFYDSQFALQSFSNLYYNKPW